MAHHTLPGSAPASERTLEEHDLVRGTLTALATERSRLLRDDGERGSQTVEYALVGGVAACLAAALMTFITGGNLIQRVIEAVVTGLIKLVTGWF